MKIYYRYFTLAIFLTGFNGTLWADNGVSSAFDRLSAQLVKSIPDSKASDKITITVFPFGTPPALYQKRVGFSVSETLISHLLSSGKVSVSDRADVNNAMKSKNIQNNVFDNDTAVAMATTLGTAYVVVGSVEESASKYQISARIISTSSKQVLSTAYEEVDKTAFDGFASDYLVNNVAGAPAESTVTNSSSSNNLRKLGKIGLEFYGTYVKNANSDQFKNTYAPMVLLRLWLSNALSIETGASYFEQKMKQDFLLSGTMDVSTYFLGAQLRLDKGQRVVPYIGGGAVLADISNVVPNRDASNCQDTDASYVFCNEEISKLNHGNYFNAGLTGYFSENRNWSFLLDYRRINVNFSGKVITDYFSKTSPFSTIEVADQGVVDMSMEFYSLGLGYHF